MMSNKIHHYKYLEKSIAADTLKASNASRSNDNNLNTTNKTKKMDYKEFIKIFINKTFLILLGYIACYIQWTLWPLLIAFAAFLYMKKQNLNHRAKISMKAKICSNNKEDILSKIDEMPSWVRFPDYERAEWLNEIIMKLWPSMNNFIIKLIRGKIQTNIRKKYTSFRFENVDFGCNPPKIDGIKIYNCALIKSSIIIDFDVYYDGNCDINFSLSGAQIGRIKDFQLSVQVRVVLKPILSKMPIIGGIQVFFLNTPDMNFDLEGISSIPGLSYFLRQQIEKKLKKLIVFPNKVSKKFSKSVEASELKVLEPEGILRVHLAEGKDLEKKDITGKSDPYAILYVGAQEFQTEVIKKCLNPKWDYWCEFIILDPMSQHLGFKIFDEDDLNEDDFLGSGEVEIGSILKNNKTDQWIKLENVKHGQIHLRFTWLSLSSDYSALEAAKEETELLKATNINTGLLNVYVDCARNLPLVNSFKKPDPYFTLTVRSTKQKSKTKRHTVDPVWEEGFTFLVPNPEIDSLNLTIFDKHSDLVLNQFCYDIKDLSTEPTMQISKIEFPLNKNEPESKIILSLQLKILINGVFEYDDSDSSEDENFSQAKSTSSYEGNAGLVQEEYIRKSMSSSYASKTRLDKSLSSLSDGEFQLGKIDMSFTYSEPRQKLVVIIHKICNLPLKDLDDIPDPYVKLKLLSPENSVKYKTKVIKNNCDPIYEETFEYLLSLDDLNKQKLIVTVKTAKKLFYDINIGQVVINLETINFKGTCRNWFDLKPVKS